MPLKQVKTYPIYSGHMHMTTKLTMDGRVNAIHEPLNGRMGVFFCFVLEIRCRTAMQRRGAAECKMLIGVPWL